MNDFVGSWGSCKCEKQRGKECVAERGRSKMMDTVNVTGAGTRICLVEDLEVSEDPRTPSLRRISYGIILPTICCFGIVGNILNLVVLTRRNMRGTAYIYMRGKSLSVDALTLCIIFTFLRHVLACKRRKKKKRKRKEQKVIYTFARNVSRNNVQEECNYRGSWPSFNRIKKKRWEVRSLANRDAISWNKVIPCLRNIGAKGTATSIFERLVDGNHSYTSVAVLNEIYHLRSIQYLPLLAFYRKETRGPNIWRNKYDYLIK